MIHKILNFLFGTAIIILIATIIRTLVYLLIGLQTERIFRTELIIIWGICIAVVLFKIFFNISKKPS